MKNSTSTTTLQMPRQMEPKYGHHIRRNNGKQPKPRVYTTTVGYRIEPWYYAKGQGTDDFETVLKGERPGWVEFMVLPLAFLPPLYLLMEWYLDRKYERQFWIKNGFDPDSFN